MMIQTLLWLAALTGLSLAASTVPAAVAGAVPFRLSGQGPYHQLKLPLGWQAVSRFEDQADVRILGTSLGLRPGRAGRLHAAQARD